jgi:short-subunit dehydrogenase
MKIRGKTVLITGASSGIGAATARAVARAGGRPILLARTQELLDALVAEIGGEARAYSVDCGDREAVARAAEQITAEVGTPDVIVNNAGAGGFFFFDETDPEEFERMMAVPYFAAVYVTRAFIPAMIARGSGHVVTVNTPIAFFAWASAAGYAGARWALRGFSEALRADLRGTGVGVSQVVPAKVSSTYFEHNPGAERAIPGVSRVVGTVTPEQVADRIVQAVEREQRLVLMPLTLRVLVAFGRLWPQPIELLLASTGRRRPDAA